MSSPHRAPRTPDRRSENSLPRTPSRNTPRQRQVNGNVRTPSSRNTTPARRRLAGASERDVVSGSEADVPSQAQNAPYSSPFHQGKYNTWQLRSTLSALLIIKMIQCRY